MTRHPLRWAALATVTAVGCPGWATGQPTPTGRASEQEPPAEPGPPLAPPATDREGEPSVQGFALGVTPALELRRDYGAGWRTAFVPEVVGLGYLPAWGMRWFYRPGARLGVDGISQPEMPEDLQVVERGLRLLGEWGLGYDGVVVPALSLGGGLVARWITLKTGGAVHGTDALDRRELLGTLYAQLGVGVPIERGLLVAEPFARAQYTLSDDRAPLRFGVDLTLSL